jgi:nitroimidazol reductase NimA-like FMN-containing flavoprotein (pyridoxamine 5'-phosphate oxidase superfamily)
MRKKEREIKDISEIENVIKSSDVCRIAFANDNLPYLVTMNFGYSGGNDKKLYFHCAREGKKLEMIKKNNYVCFEFDTDHDLHEEKTACGFGMGYRSVVGWGRIEIIDEDEGKKQGLNQLMAQYSDRDNFLYDKEILDKCLVLRLDIIEMKGKKC